MAIINATASDTLVFTESDFGIDSRPTSDTLTFSELVCVQGEFHQLIAESLSFSEYALGLAPSNTNPDGGLGTGPPVFFGDFKRFVGEGLFFVETVSVAGGLILDNNCTPTAYVSNTMSWGMLADWTFMSFYDWNDLS
jgi:hypothetical protein